MLFGPEHVKRYVETDGEVGHVWQRGATVLLLTVKRRKSGGEQTIPLIYNQDGDRFIVCASKGGSDAHPDWYLNLVANPEVAVQVKADRFKARAHTADPEEKASYWPGMVRMWPDYDNYQKKTSREIPLVVLERV